MLRSSHILLTAGLLSLSAGAFAQPPGAPMRGPGGAGGPAMHTPITRTDLKTQLEAHFDQLDANHDGKISKDDGAARREARMHKVFTRLDADKNGSISKDEFVAAREDGKGHRGKMRADNGPSPRGMHANMMRQSDTPLTKAAFVANGLARFDKADTNHDGTISTAERDAARALMRDQRGRAKMPPAPTPNP